MSQHVIPRDSLDSMLRTAGIGGVAAVPATLAMFAGAEEMPPDMERIRVALAHPGAVMRCTFSVDGVPAEVAVEPITVIVR